MKAVESMPILKDYPLIANLWEDVYRERKKKVNSKKAKYSANAAANAEMLKVFLNKGMRYA
tara:strand:- start:269 stop:451 length:183 start_codon:yes stop_codon:yes gene_type:complete